MFWNYGNSNSFVSHIELMIVIHNSQAYNLNELKIYKIFRHYQDCMNNIDAILIANQYQNKINLKQPSNKNDISNDYICNQLIWLIFIPTMFKTALIVLLVVANIHSFSLQSQTFAPYDISKSRDYSIFASLAYCPRQCLQNWSCGSGESQPLTDVSYIENNTTKAGGYIGYSPTRNLIILSFRGSANIQNWIQNANFQKSPYLFCLKCQVHTGFMADYVILQPTINNKIKALIGKYPTATLLTTGHSLGGALGMIAAMQLKRVFSSLNIEIHHYGGPRVGNVHLAKHINNKIQNIYRVVHNKDIVPHLPPDLPEFEYHHSAYEIFFNQDMTSYKTCGSSGEDKSCSNQYFPIYTTDDHHFYFRKMSSPTC